MHFTAALLLPFLAGLCLASPAPVLISDGQSGSPAENPSPAPGQIDPSVLYSEVARTTWYEGDKSGSHLISPGPLPAGVEHILAFRCDRLRRLIGVKISQPGQPVPTRYTIIDKTEGRLPFTLAVTGEVRFDFAWQFFDLESSRIRTTEERIPEAEPQIEPFAPEMAGMTMTQPPRPVETRAPWWDWPQHGEIRRSPGELVIMMMPWPLVNKDRET